MPEIDGERLLGDLKRLADFGRYETGVHRPTYSAVDIASRQWLADKFAEAGLDPVIDGIGNVFGRAEGVTHRLLVGSHSETQPRGGWLDGALGVIYGLELARAFAADPSLKGLGIETVAWADEEGHYGNMLGSRSFTGRLSETEIATARNREGETLCDALRRAGYAGRPRIAADPDRYLGYLEAHIEQGDTLDSTGRRIGVVEGIVGIWNWRVVFSGQQNHAGTTQMARRRDAGVAMVRLAAQIHDRFAALAAARTVWTIGRMLIDPNAPSVVPGRAEMQVQVRDVDTAILARYRDALLAMVADADRAGPCTVTIEELSQTEPRLMDPAFEAAIEATAERYVPGGHVRMPSGAGHDAQVISHRLRAGMMFIPSLKGISHHWSEDTREDDIVLGAQVFADAAAAILKAG
ncbi:MAG TPA: hydantoinase/carbamoylase family amidase [Stellaceae bacterium]|nr:hydantoinase/carbamoylase family amidase [Stellaceae bacterium]